MKLLSCDGEEGIQIEIDKQEREIMELALSLLGNNLHLAKQLYAWDCSNKSSDDTLLVEGHMVILPKQKEVMTLLKQIVAAE